MFKITPRCFQTLIVGLLLSCASFELHGGTLTGTFSPITTGSNVNLTVIGKLDWVHWGLYTDTSVNRKSCVSPQISDFTLAGDAINNFLAAYQYSGNSNGYTWYDGAPVVSVTNTTTGVWADQEGIGGSLPVGSGFQFTVPADTNTRILQVFVGAYAAKGKFEASLSDNSATSFVSGNAPGSTVDNPSNGPGGVFTITYSANSAGKTLTVKWTVASAYVVFIDTPNVTLQAAALTAPGADNPPFASLTNPVSNATFTEPATITLKANAQDFDGTVTNVSFYSGDTKLGQSTSSPYSYPWSGVLRGHYTLTAYATDNAGTTSCSQPVEIFVYGSGGGQTNSIAAAPSVIDLTSEGTADWSHWGLVTNTSFDHKALVQQKISNFSVLGTHPVEQYSGNYTTFYWSDGTPTPSEGGTTTGVYITGVTNGFSLTAPADTTPRQLRLYVGGYGVQAQFQAYLSDLSAPPYIDTSISNVYDTAAAEYTISYTASSAGQHLIVNFRSINAFDLAYGNVNLPAATLQGGAFEPLPVYLFDPMRVGSVFLFSFASQSNASYAVQRTDSLLPTNWTTVTNLTGTGGTVTVTNQYANTGQRFYRVQSQ